MSPWQYIALIGAVIAVVAFIIPKRKSDLNNASSGAQIEQFELAFEQFMDNMEKEQDDLVRMLTQSLQQMKEEERVKAEIIARLEQKNSNLEEQLTKLSNAIAAAEAKLQILVANPTQIKASDKKAEHISEENVLGTSQDNLSKPISTNSIHYRYAELFDMYNAGKSIETIAKKLGKNKGEVQLIIQLAAQEESARNA